MIAPKAALGAMRVIVSAIERETGSNARTPTRLAKPATTAEPSTSTRR